jgi:hypothetical protein
MELLDIEFPERTMMRIAAKDKSCDFLLIHKGHTVHFVKNGSRWPNDEGFQTVKEALNFLRASEKAAIDFFASVRTPSGQVFHDFFDAVMKHEDIKDV